MVCHVWRLVADAGMLPAEKATGILLIQIDMID